MVWVGAVSKGASVPVRIKRPYPYPYPYASASHVPCFFHFPTPHSAPKIMRLFLRLETQIIAKVEYQMS